MTPLGNRSPAAVSNSARVQFSELGMFHRRAMARVNQILGPITRKNLPQSDKNFGNRYKFDASLIVGKN